MPMPYRLYRFAVLNASSWSCVIVDSQSELDPSTHEFACFSTTAASKVVRGQCQESFSIFLLAPCNLHDEESFCYS